jgi:tetratricopeptide (TPR) repeat protein
VRAEDSENVRRAVVHRMLDHYLHTAALAVRILRPQQAVPVVLEPVQAGVTVAEVRTESAAVGWFAAEHPVLHALVELAARDGFDAHAYQLADALTSTLWYGGARWLGGPSVYETALAAARRLGDPLGLALSHRAFAVLHLTHDRLDDAEAQLVAALGFAEEIDDLGLLADIHQGLAKVNEGMRRHVVQREHTETALDLFRAVGNQVGVAISYNNLAWCLTELGDYERAVTLCKQAFELFEDFPDRKSEANTWDTLGYASRHLGHHEEAIACYRRAIELHRQINSRVQEAHAYRKIGDIRYDRGAIDEARAEWRRALDIFSELGLPGGVKEIRERLARLDEH